MICYNLLSQKFITQQQFSQVNIKIRPSRVKYSFTHDKLFEQVRRPFACSLSPMRIEP